MSLTKEDLEKIGKIVEKSEDRVKKELKSELTAQIVGVKQELTAKIGGVQQELTAKIDGVEQELKSELTTQIVGVKQELKSEITEAKEEILGILGKEIDDLADINRAVINRTEELDYRLRIVERKLGLKTR